MVDTAVQQSILENERDQRAGVYGLFGRLWLSEIDARFLRKLKENCLDVALQSVGIEIQGLEIGQLDRLAADYCRLFVPPIGHVSPYQSVVTSGKHHGWATESMNDYLKYVEIPRSNRQLVDHFGFQMQVMSVILTGKVLDHGRNILDQISSRFFRDHILWARKLCFDGGSNAETDFYKTLLSSTASFLKLEADIFNESEL